MPIDTMPSAAVLRKSVKAYVRLSKYLFGEDPSDPEVESVYRDGNKEVLILKRSKTTSTTPRPAVIHMHGGGFVLGAPG